MAKKFFRNINICMITMKIKPTKITLDQKIKQKAFISTKKPTTKVDWEIAGRCNDTKMIKPFSIKHPLLDTLTVSIREVNRELDVFLIELKNSLQKVFSRESMLIEPESQRIRGMSIETAEEYRATKKGRKYGFGELVRLTSIMEMLENKCKYISIFAKNTAVYFHAKYKFQPNITDKKNALDILSCIINDSSPGYKDMSQKAKKLYQELENKEIVSEEQKTLLLKKVNKLVDCYIKKALLEGKNGQGHEFEKGMNMILTEEVIQKEKNFFNKKFKNQGIQYKIQ